MKKLIRKLLPQTHGAKCDHCKALKKKPKTNNVIPITRARRSQ